MANMLDNKFVFQKNGIDYTRSKFAYEKRHSTNVLLGKIVPVHYEFIKPGDTPDFRFGCVIESAPIIAPSLDNIYADVVSIWTPTRLVMTEFNEWLGESNVQAFTLNRNIHYPHLQSIAVTDWTAPDGTIFDANTTPLPRGFYADWFRGPHLGFRLHNNFDLSWIPSESQFQNGVSTIPSRIYDLNYNTFFRNENVQTPILFSKSSVDNDSIDTSLYGVGLGVLHTANSLKNFYNVATPAPSLLDVNLGLDEMLSVTATNVRHAKGSSPMEYNTVSGNAVSDGSYASGVYFGSNVGAAILGTGSLSFSETLTPVNLWADTASLTVNKMYYALMLQKFANKMGQGRRSVEFYANIFGVHDSEAGHDLPRLLIQKRYPLNQNQVIATSSYDSGGDNTTYLGERSGFSITGFGDNLVNSFTSTEYGMIQTYLIIRTQPSLSSGIDKHLAYNKLLDTYLPHFDHLGPVGIEYIEIGEYNNIVSMAQHYIGYTNAWYEDRKQVSDVVGVMEPDEPLGYKTFARSWRGLNTVTISSPGFIQEDSLIYDRILKFKYWPLTALGAIDWSELPNFAGDGRYQFLVQFVVKGSIARIMSPDSEPLQMRL